MQKALSYPLTNVASGAAPVRVASVTEESVVLPSGLKARLQEVLTDQPGDGLVYRFRFVAPDFAANGADHDVLARDMEFLCAEYALPRLSNIGPTPSQVVISLADKPSEFGVFNPDVSQVFEAFSVDSGVCQWEFF